MTTATVEGAGVELAYDERGEGDPLVLVHGTASTRTLWAEVLDALGDEFRAIAYDRRGYGDSGAPEGFTAATIPEHGDDLIALVRRLDLAPVLLCGHSLGAMPCLDVMIREPELVRAAVLIEPPMLWLGPHGSEATSELRAVVEEAAATQGTAGAIAAFSTTVCGPDALEIVGDERAMAARESPRGFGADLSAGANWAVAPRELRGIGTRIVFITGTRTPRAYREPGEALARMIPGAELRECESGHLVPNEQPGVVADAIRAIAQP